MQALKLYVGSSLAALVPRIEWTVSTDAITYQMGTRCVQYQVANPFPSNIPTVAVICFPDVLKRIQAELDGVIGRDRLPTFDDESSLPFFRAFIKEVTR